MTDTPSYDAIIVGGRPAGASLALRLARRGRRVLVLDRAHFPSLPHVPSCPTIHMGTMALLDELGIPEAAYAADAVRFDTFVVQFGEWFTATIPFPTTHGRAWGYSIDRDAFDRMLWDRLGSEPNITRRDGFSVESLLRDDGGRVIGLTGKTKDGPEEWFTAPWVVGADGRFSTIARRVDAKTVEEQTEKVSTVYFADWVGFTPRVPGKDLVEVYSTGRGMNVLCFPLSGGRVTVCIHIRADRVDIEGDAEAWYRAKLQSIPAIAARLSGARTVSRVLGLKRVGNGYREAGGPGWVLTGDALHYKDPVDGQGIYDALIETKILAEELEAGFAGKAPEAVLAAYTERTRAATHAMYAATQKRLADELYSEPPVPVIRTMIRWMLTDRAYQVRFIRFLTRDLDPATWIGPGLVAGAVLRGIGRDLRSLFVKQPKALPGPA